MYDFRLKGDAVFYTVLNSVCACMNQFVTELYNKTIIAVFFFYQVTLELKLIALILHLSGSKMTNITKCLYLLKIASNTL